MAESGYFLVHRRIWDNAVSYKPKYLAIWLYLISHANYKDKSIIWNNEKIDIKRGQFVGSISQIAEHFDMSTGTVSYILDYLISEKMIEKRSNRRFTVFTVKNYDAYQKVESTSENKLKTNRKQIENKLKQLKKDNKDNKDNNISKDKKKSSSKSEEYGNKKINRMIAGINNNLEIKLPEDGKARRTAWNMIKLLTKRNKDGEVKAGREFLSDKLWENAKKFMSEYKKVKLDQGFTPESWSTVYRNLKLWIANKGKIK